MAPYYSKAYLSTQIQTADRLELVISLYEAAQNHVLRAIEAMEREDHARRGESIQRAAEILLALSASLDFTCSGDLVGRLFASYNTMLRQLLDANRTSNVELLEIVHSTLGALLEGWRTVQASPEAAHIREEDREAEMSMVRGIQPRHSHSSSRNSASILA
jgi:flagellar protein FliS